MYDGPSIERLLGVPQAGALARGPSDLLGGKGKVGGQAPRAPAASRAPAPAQAPAVAPAALPDPPPFARGDRVPQSAMGYLSPELAPWGAERLPVEGEILLPGATGAAAGVGTSATAVSNADGLSVAASATQAEVCGFDVPPNKIAIVTGIRARPDARLGCDSGHVTFQLDLGGQKTQLPQRLRGVLGGPGDEGSVRRVYRRDSTNALIDPNAFATGVPSVGPCYGLKKFKVWMRTPGGVATLTIQQFLKASATAAGSASFATGGANGVVTGEVDVFGELFGITLQNDGASPAQRPEVLVTLVGYGLGDLVPVHYVAKPGTRVALLATNASLVTWHVVQAAFEVMLIERELYRRYVETGV